MTEIFHNLSERTANVYVTVLAAAGIAYHLEKRDSGWCIYVRAMDVERALIAVSQYHEENRVIGSEENVDLSTYTATWTGVYIAAVIALVHVVVNTLLNNRDVIENFGSSASRIISGEQYRTITSLLLHGDFIHLMGNMLGIVLFGTGVCSIAGWGAGVLIIVFTGGIGNLINAYFYGVGHVSIGASTSVFGCIGFLSAYQFMVKMRAPGQKLGAWIAIAAGFALLAILGSSEYTDIMAHLFGFLTGIGIGLLYNNLIQLKFLPVYQYACFMLVLGVLCMAWIVGL